ncbi:unnamed protein product [Ilex paraguariensis]|uniref:WRC domain-containing protein n=1 Tax=Ilex paraguariensis TaxID=185542 RepID=A0ABC8QNW7_9AQUA
MRIRKHAKISPLMFSSSGLQTETLFQTHMCQLNQSPWDVITFPPSDPATPQPPPPPFQVDGDDSFTGNGSLGDSVGAVESVESMKISFNVEEENNTKEEFDAMKWVYSDSVKVYHGIEKGQGENGEEEERENNLGFKKEHQSILCCKTDGKGWHCKREAKEGHSLCQHHLTQLQNYTNLAHPTAAAAAKKHDKAVENRRRPRPKKASASSKNPNEFYYYSGFGPLWGKRRGPGRVEKEAELNKCIGSEAPVKPVVVLVETTTSPSSSCQICKEIRNNQEFDYVEDEDEEEDEDEDEENGEVEYRRVRKPIKARSLKSLM